MDVVLITLTVNGRKVLYLELKSWRLSQCRRLGCGQENRDHRRTNGFDLANNDGRTWHSLKRPAGEAPDDNRNCNALSLPFAVGPGESIRKTGCRITSPHARPPAASTLLSN